MEKIFNLNDKNNLNILNDEIEQALKMVAAKFGLSIKPGNVRYEPHGGECTVQLRVKTNEKPKAAEQQSESHLELYGLPGYYNKKIVATNKKVFTVTGINGNSRKNPVTLMGEDGRTASCSVAYVKLCKLV